MEGLVSYLSTFLAGAMSGAAGQYLAARFTEKRQSKEARSSFERQMGSIRDAMPELLSEMEADFSSEAGLLVREFIVLPSEGVSFNSSKERFVYFESAHRNLKGKLDILEQYGLICDVTPHSMPIFRVTEEFHAYLRS